MEGLGGIHGQPGLGEDMLAGLERGQGNGAMQVRPGADDDGVDLVVGDQVLPLGECAGNAKLAGHGCRGLWPAIANRDNVDAFLGQQAWNVPQTGIGPGADQTDSQSLSCHDGGSLGEVSL